MAGGLVAFESWPLDESCALCCCKCFAAGEIVVWLRTTLRLALRLRVWRPRTRLRLIRLLMRAEDRDAIPSAA